MGQKGSLKKFFKYIKLDENENTTEELWDIAKAMLRGKFRALSAYTEEEKT